AARSPTRARTATAPAGSCRRPACTCAACRECHASRRTAARASRPSRSEQLVALVGGDVALELALVAVGDHAAELALEHPEVGDDAVDVVLGARDAGPAQLDELAGPADALGEHVDVEVVALELLEDALELGHRLGVAELAARVVGAVVRCAHGSRLSTSCTTLAAVPSANSVRSRSPVLSAAARFTTCPSRSRVTV